MPLPSLVDGPLQANAPTDARYASRVCDAGPVDLKAALADIQDPEVSRIVLDVFFFVGHSPALSDSGGGLGKR